MIIISKLKFLLAIILLMTSWQSISAQNDKKDNVPAKQENEVAVSDDSIMTTIRVADLTKMESEIKSLRQQLKGVKSDRDSLKSKYDKTLAKSHELSEKHAQTEQELTKLRGIVLQDDKERVNIASNFLYIPYESYSVDSIAITTYEGIHDAALKEKYNIRYTLLKNYKNHIVEFVNFLTKTQKDFNPFADENFAGQKVQQLKSLRCYKAYLAYSDGNYTFLGSRMKKTLTMLQSFKHGQKLDFNSMIQELSIH